MSVEQLIALSVELVWSSSSAIRAAMGRLFYGRCLLLVFGGTHISGLYISSSTLHCTKRTVRVPWSCVLFHLPATAPLVVQACVLYIGVV